MTLSRRSAVVAILLLSALASCVNQNRPPTQQDNICAILDQRPGWLNDLERTQRQWGVHPADVMAIIWKESSFRARARTRRTYSLGSIPSGYISSAFGFSQALDGTWEWYQDETNARGARRQSFRDAVDFIGWYMNQSLQRNNIALDDAENQYLAYHEGHTGYARGSYRLKSWLPPVARQVQRQADLYRSQLPYCR
ncbi:lytic transglycosylase [Abyssibius alkaniclasticus]|uniref:transglycosylase SLT domain-containing protein n=1 Tax=Abyssibius alkaniclasticus TaxID=2881234 RepID=UPI0023641FB7|nr:transglycosylase SLT domain-containing protein [Abyssibius alkaniclasticus]UPH71649.1 lytic transglycosylase [Abyssibius alkaniclasticus]